MQCKLCKKEITKNKHGEEKKFCSPKCRNYYNFHNLGSRRGDVFRQITQKSYSHLVSSCKYN